METKYKTFLIVAIVLLTSLCSTLAESEAKELGIKIERNVPVPMRDGTILRANVYRPDRGGPYPVLVYRTPYGKGRNFDRFVKAGYIVVSQDVRGRYKSDGKWVSLFRFQTQEAKDGYDTVEWAARLPNSNGKVGTFGISYPAFLQWCLAPLRPPSLVAMSACSNPAKIWDLSPSTIRPGSRLEWWDIMAYDMRRRENIPGVHTQWERFSLWKEEHQKWEHWLPWSELPEDFFGHEAQVVKSWLANPHVDPWRFDEECKDITVPNLDIVGWYDQFHGDLLLFRAMAKYAATETARKGSKIIVGPWNHGLLGQSRVGRFDFGSDAALDLTSVRIRWFDYWLKSKQNGVDKETPVRIFIMGDNKWRDEQSWPLQRSKDKIFYITSGGYANTPSGDGRLIVEKKISTSFDNYSYDPNDPVPSLFSEPIPKDQQPLATRQDILVYQTEPLDERIEITGYPVVELYASSSAADTDWFVRLIDIAPDGLARNVSSGMVRARYRDGFDKPRLIEPNRVVKYAITMRPTSNAFLAGHRIHLDITSSDFPHYDRNHNTAANQNADATLVTAKQTIYHGGEQATRVVLPWVPNTQEEEKPAGEETAESVKGEQTYPLHQALENGDIEEVKDLLSRGADVNSEDGEGKTLLWYAVKTGKLEIVRLLIEAGADVNKGSISPLTEVTWQNEREGDFISIAEYLIKEGAQVDIRGFTPPLIRATGYSSLEMIELLVSNGADVNIQDRNRMTPLHHAARRGIRDAVEFLIKKGADVNARDREGMVALNYVSSPLSSATATDKKDTMELLVAKITQLDSKDGNGLTCLHDAAVKSLPDLADVLLNRGAKVDERDDNYEFTALHYTARFGSTKVAEVLIAHGADIKAKDKWDYEPIHWAAYHDRPEIIELLIAKGADVNAKTSLDQTPLQLAKPRRNTAAIKVLRKHGAKEFHH